MHFRFSGQTAIQARDPPFKAGSKQGREILQALRDHPLQKRQVPIRILRFERFSQGGTLGL